MLNEGKPQKPQQKYPWMTEFSIDQINYCWQHHLLVKITIWLISTNTFDTKVIIFKLSLGRVWTSSTSSAVSINHPVSSIWWWWLNVKYFTVVSNTINPKPPQNHTLYLCWPKTQYNWVNIVWCCICIINVLNISFLQIPTIICFPPRNSDYFLSLFPIEEIKIRHIELSLKKSCVLTIRMRVQQAAWCIESQVWEVFTLVQQVQEVITLENTTDDLQSVWHSISLLHLCLQTE